MVVAIIFCPKFELQLLINQLLSVFMVWYIAQYKPMNSRRLNRLEMINELGLIFLTNSLFMFTEYIGLAQLRY